MYEYTCTPRSRTWCAYLGVLASELCAVAIWIAMAQLTVPYPLIWYAASLFALTGALLITVRCLLWRYVYQILATEDGGFDLAVLLVRGNGSSRAVRCVCRISTDQLLAIEAQGRSRRPRPTYRWCILPRDRTYVLTLTDGGETVTARFAPDAVMARMIADSLGGIWNG